MSRAKRRQLAQTVAGIQQKHGPRALHKGSELTASSRPAFVSTGFPQLDALTGCGGIPLGHLTLLSGPPTSGKLTLAYKTLAHAQQGQNNVAILDLVGTTDVDYLARCGLNLAQLFLVRPGLEQVTPLLLDLVNTRQLRLILLDNLSELQATRAALHQLRGALETLVNLLRHTNCSVLLLDEPQPLWRRWLSDRRGLRQKATLHIALRHERWLSQQGELCGYQVQAAVTKSRWAQASPPVALQITFNGAVKAGGSW